MSDTVLNTMSVVYNDKYIEDLRKRLIAEDSERKLSMLSRSIERRRGRGLSETQYVALINKVNALKEELKGKYVDRPRIVRSFREYLVCILDEEIGKALDKFGVTGFLRSAYLGIGRKCLVDLYEYLDDHPDSVSEKELTRVFENCVHPYRNRLKLNERILKRVYLALFDIMIHYTRLLVDFEDKCRVEGLPFVYIRGETKTALST